MEKQESLDSLSMAKIWQLARARKIDVNGKKKKQLIQELIEADKIVPEVPVEPKKVEEKPKEKLAFVEATLVDGTKIKVPAKDVVPAKKEKNAAEVIIKSVDGRELEVSIGRDHWVGQTITIPAEIEDEIKRLLKGGGFYFV